MRRRGERHELTGCTVQSGCAAQHADVSCYADPGRRNAVADSKRRRNAYATRGNALANANGNADPNPNANRARRNGTDQRWLRRDKRVDERSSDFASSERP